MLISKILRNPFIACFLIVAIIFSFHFTPNVIEKKANDFSKLKDGDIIFQSSEFGQGKAIQLATHSKYTHCGIVFKENNTYMVYEAVQPVKKTPIDKWILNSSDDHRYFVKRLKDTEILTPTVIAKMKDRYKQFEGKNYDLYFGWSDERIYCSELVWKIYQNATGLEIGALQKLKDFDLSNPIVQLKLRERYGDKIPYEEKVISPSAIYASELLVTVE
ncbi:MAG TPA: YiiX family permuted papain-like enzyme [Cytophagaceae bacterium]|nr:YiiX family permuted papain-like enzyme [Cytophagaceae bacterium]